MTIRTDRGTGPDDPVPGAGEGQVYRTDGSIDVAYEVRA